jgi:diacylglycerol kinase family enzyme
MDMHKKSSEFDAAVIVNAAAGQGCSSSWATDLANQFSSCGIKAKITLAKNGDEIQAAAQSAIDAGISVLVAGGGDGTVNAVASHVANTDLTLGILPMGTLNHFAKDALIPLELEAAIRTIANGRRVLVDAADVNGRLFINNSSIGLYPQIVRHREQQQRLGRSKWNAFFWAMLSTVRRFPFYRITVHIDGKENQRKTPFVFVGNNSYTMEGFHIGERAKLNAGLLSYYTAQKTGRAGLLQLAFRALLGRLRQDTDFEAVQTTALRIETRRRSLRVSTDGEVNILQTPLQYRILPGALRVIVPQGDDAKDGI